jgi:hypothetical protein
MNDPVRKDVEDLPAMEVHLGEIVGTTDSQGIKRYRKCIVWLNGKRWEGLLSDVTEECHGPSSHTVV